MKKLLRLQLVIGFILFSVFAFGQPRTTSQPGPWNSTATWGGLSVPDNTFGLITVNHAVTVDADLSINLTIISATGSVTVDPLITLTLVGATGVELTVAGTLTINGSIVNSGAATVTYSGASLVNNGTLNIGTNTLTWSGSGTLSGTGNTTVDDLDVTGTSFTYTASGSLTLNDDIIGTGTFNSSSASGTVIFAGATSAISGSSPKIFNNLQVTGVMTPAVSYTVNGNISGTGTLAAGTVTTTFAGGPTLISGSGAKNFFDVTINSGTAVTYSSNVGISGVNLIVNGTGSLTTDVPTSPAIITFTTLAISGAGVKDFTNVTIGTGASTTPNTDYTIRGNLVVTGTLLQTSGTVTFAGTTAKSGAGACTFNDVVVNSGASFSSTTSHTINGAFTNNSVVNFTAGTLTLGAASVTTLANLPASTTFNAITTTAGSTITDGATSSTTITGAFAGAGSYVSLGTTTFNGTVAMSGAGTKTFNNLIVNGTSLTPGANISYTVTGNISGTGTLAAGSGTSTTTFSGSTLILGSGAKNFFDVTINLGTSVTYSSNVDISGNNLIVNGSLATDIITSPAIITFTTLAISGAGTKDFTNVTIGAGASTTPNADYTIRGNLVLTGTLLQTAGTATFAGTTVISGAGASTFNNVTVNLGANVSGVSLGTINGIFDNNGTVNFTSGTLNLGAASATDLMSSTSTTFNALTTVLGATITDAPGTTLTITGNFVGGADYTSQGTTTFSGTVAMSGAGTKTFNNLIVNGTSLTPAANISYTVTGSISGTGLLNDGSGTSSTTFSGTTIPITGSGVKDFFDIIINGGTSVTYTSSISVNGATLVGTGNLASASPTSTITFTSVAISGAGTRDFANVTIATGASTISGAYSITGNLVMTGSLISTGTPTFSGTTTVSGAGALTFTDIIITSPNTLTLSAATITVNGNITNSGTINPGSGTLAFSGTSIITNTGTMNLNNVTLNSASTVTAPSTVMGIAGVFTFTGGGTPAVFNHGGGTIEFNTANAVASRLGGTAAKTFNNIDVTGIFNNTQDFTVNGNISNSGTINCTAGAVTWGVSGALSGTGTPTTTFFNLIVAASQTLSISTFPVASPITISSDLTLTGNLNHTALNTIIIGDDQLGATGTLTSSGTIQFNGAASAFTVGGTKTFTNLSVGGAGVLSVGAASSFSIDGILNVAGTLNAGTGVSVTTFGNVFVGATPSITGAGTINLDDVVIASVHTLTSASGTVQLTGNLTITGSFVHNSGTVLFRTVGPNNITGTPSTFFNLTVGNGVGNTTVTNSLAPLSLAGRLNMNGTATNVFNTGGATNFILLSTGDNPTVDGSIGTLTNGFSSIVGTMTVQRYVSSEGRIYRYLASPVVGATVADWQDDFFVTGTFGGSPGGSGPSTPGCTGCTTNASTFRYDETLLPVYTGVQPYVAYPDPTTGLSSDVLQNGRGYSVYFRHNLNGVVNIDYIGTHPSTAGVTLNVAPSTSAGAGYSLVGNPYPSAILWDNGTGWVKSNIADQIAIKDNASGVFQYFSAAAGNGVIAAGQSFWVQSTGVGSLQVNENAKTAASGIFYRSELESEDAITLTLTKQSTGVSDVAKMYIAPNSTLAYDVGLDAGYWNNITGGGDNIIATQDDLGANTNVQVFDLEFFTEGTTKAVSINAIPSLDCGNQTFNIRTAQLALSGEPVLNYTFDLQNFGAFSGMNWKLYDKYPNATTPLEIDLSSNPSYSFTVDYSILASRLSTRFYLVSSSNTSISTNLPITSSSQVCESSSTAITIGGSQLNMMYGVEVNGTYYPNVAQGTGSDLNVPLKSEWLNATSNTVKVKVNSGCDVKFLTATTQITKESLYTAIPVAVQSCIAGAVTLAASGALVTTNYNWYDSQTSSTPVATGNQFVTPALSDNTTYYVSAFNSLGCEGARAAITANISDAGALVSVVPSATSVCRNSTITFNATSSLSGTFKWYASLTSTSILSTSDQFTSPQLLKTKKYYVSFVNANGCEGGRIEALAQISNFSPVLGAETGLGPKTICAQGSYTFTANGAPSSSEYAWFDSMDSATPLIEAKEFTTPALSATRSYYLAAKNELGCYTDRYKIDAVVDLTDPTAGVTVTGDNTCLNSNAVIKLSHPSPNITYNWYASETGTDLISRGADYATDILTENKSVYASAINANGCEGTRKKIDVKVSNFSQTLLVDTGIGEKQVCPQGSYNFTASGALSGASYAWFDSQESTTPLAETATFTTPALSESMSYYLAAKNAFGCYSSNRKKVEALVDVEDPSSNLAAKIEAVCKNSKANIVVSDGRLNATYYWYDLTSSTTPIATGKLFTTEDLIDSKTYYVSAVNKNGCEGSRTEAMVEVNTFEDASISQVSDEVLESSYEEGNQWYFNDILLTGENKQTLTVSESGNYAVKVSVNGCTASAAPFKVELVTGFDDPTKTISVYPNPASEVVSVRFVGNEDVNVSFIDQRGAILAPVKLQQEGRVRVGELDVRSFSRGLYFIRIYSETRSITHKVIIK